MDFGDYVVHIYSTYNPDSGERLGQYAFNELVCTAKRLDLSRKVTATEFDPFHNDANMPDFLDFLAFNWY